MKKLSPLLFFLIISIASFSQSVCPTSYNASATNETIYNGCNGTITIYTTGGNPSFIFEYSEVGNPGNTGSILYNGTSYTFINLCPGDYYIAVYDDLGNYCPIGGPPGNNTVTIFPAAAALSVTCLGNGGSPACSGMSGMVEANASGDLPPFQYNFNLTTGPTGYSPSNTAFDPFICGYITVTVMDNNGNTAFAECPTSCNTPPPVQLNITPSCYALCTGSIDVSVSSSQWSAYNYGAWAPYDIYLTDGFSLNTFLGSISSPSDIVSANNICPGNYDISVISNSMGCASIPGTNAFTINQSTQVSVTGSGSTDAFCFGNCNGSISLTTAGGTPPYSIQNYDCSTGLPVAGTNNLCPGNYCPQVTDVNGCEASNEPTISVGEPTLLEIFVDSTYNETFPGSMDGEVFIHVLGGTPAYTFTVDGNMDFPPFNNLGAGNHIICVIDNNGCVSCSNFTIGNSYQCNLSVTATLQNLLCNGVCDGSISTALTGANGPANYVWTPSGATTNSITNLCAGNHCVQVTDSVGCVLDTCFTVTETSPVTIVPVINNITCFGSCDGEIQLNISGGTLPYSLQHFECSTLAPVTVYTNLCSGDYCSEITDGNGCITTTGAMTVAGPMPFEIIIDSIYNETYAGASDGELFFHLSGGVGSVLYYLDGNLSSPPFDNLSMGTYSLCAEDVNACTTCDTFFIDTNYVCNITFNLNLIPPTCAGMCNGECGLMNVAGNGNITYQWFNGSASSNVTGLCDGNYCVTISDAVGCSLDTCFEITTPAFTANAAITAVSCNGGCDGSAVVNISGGPTGNYLYSSDNSNWVSQNTFDSLCAGNYTLYFADSICMDSVSVLITEPSPLSWFFVSVTPASTSTSSDGEIYVVGTGGVVPYTYTANGGSCFNIPFGNYNVCVTDSLGCIYCDSVYVGYLTGIEPIAESDFKLFPNPASETITVLFEKSYSGNLWITDMIGNIVSDYRISNSTSFSIDISNLENGIYFIKTQLSKKGIRLIKIK